MATISALGIGSGLDLNGLLEQLNEAERGKLEPIVRQQEQQQAKISAYGQLRSALTQFQDAVGKISDASLFQSLSTNVTGGALTATAGEDANPGRYDVEVTQLARAGTLATQRVGESDVALTDTEQTLTLSFANAELDREITIPAGSSLEDIRDAINADSEAGVTASIVNDGSGYRLAFSSKETGADASITSFSFSGDISLEADTATARVGQDAEINVNGIAITSPTNRVEGAIQGITLNLEEVSAEGQSTTIVVERDTRAVREAVTDFVDAFNDLKSTIGSLTAFNGETGESGELLGDSAVRTIESRLRGVLGGGVEGGEFAMLSDVGITLQRDGTLKLDESKLDELVSGDMDALGRFFAGDGEAAGMAGLLDDTLGQLLGSNGVVESSISGAENRVESLNERYARMERSIEQTIARYRTQFGQLDAMIAQMNQTSSYLTQQFDALDAQLGRRR